ncbi:MAG: polysaccharide lyase [Bacteroidota bacterium]
MITQIKKYCSFLIVLFTTVTSCQSQVNVQDDFEKKELSKIWTTDRMVNNAFQIQSTIVRNGHNAAKITLKAGDVFEAGQGKSRDSERDELREADNLFSAEGKLYEYQFSLFLPDSFPIVPTRLVIAQWKQKCPHDSSCSDDSPVMAIRYVSGKLYITFQTDAGAKTVYETKEEIRNKWLDFKFRIRFARSINGMVEAWLNEKQIINFTGASCYSSKKGYTDKSYFYFKTGLYRDLMIEPMTIFIDEYRKKELEK